MSSKSKAKAPIEVSKKPKKEPKERESIIESKDDADVPMDVVEVEYKAELTFVGQKYATPAPGNGDRVFYQTLLEQNANSEIAQEWCLNYGVVKNESHAEMLYKLVCKRKGKDMTPVKSKPSSTTTSKETKGKSGKVTVVEEPKAKKSKKQKHVEEFDDDTGFEKSEVWEGQGKIGV